MHGAVGLGGREQLAEIQRARILSAMFDVACERGAGNVTVGHVVLRSGVSRRTFYEAFDDGEACFLAAFDEAVAHVSKRVLPAYEAPGGWRERIRASLSALLEFLDDEPLIGRFLICESLAGGAQVLERRGHALESLVAALDAGREQARLGSSVPPLAGEGVVGGVLSILHARILDEDHAPLIELVNPLMSMIVAPYLGSSAARRELERPAPTPRARSSEAAFVSDPFRDMGMRLTYRTVRVLMAIAEQSGQGVNPSNRAVGEDAGIADQGQISKLLGRLERIGLVSNAGLGPAQGAPNAWSLTAKGRQVTQTIRAHAHNNREVAS